MSTIDEVVAPPDAPDGPRGPADLPETDTLPSRPWLLRAIAAAVAVAFLGGAVGYFVGVRSERTPSNAVDIGFLQDMSDHHDQAITMALETYNRTEDPTIRGFAQDVLIFQRYELGLMAAYLADHNAARPDYDPQRLTMGWMDMPVPLQDMPGMASADDMAALKTATGTDLDHRFLALMSAHHEGGVHMATYAAEHAADPNVRALAKRMAAYQATEINEYADYRARLDATTP